MDTHKYLVYSEWDDGKGSDRETFATLKDARSYAMAEIESGIVDACYIEYVEEGTTREDRWDVELGVSTIDRLVQGTVRSAV